MSEPRRKLSIQVPELPWVEKEPTRKQERGRFTCYRCRETKDGVTRFSDKATPFGKPSWSVVEICDSCQETLRAEVGPELKAWEEARLAAMKQAAEKKHRWAGTD